MAETWQQAGERTEMPTPLRLAEARERGFVPRSADLIAAAAAAGGVAAVAVLGGGLFAAVRRLTVAMLTEAGRVSAGWSPAVAAAAWAVAGWLAGIVAVAIVVAAGANLVQFGVLFSAEAVRPDLTRLSLGAGLGRMFSTRSAVRAGLAVVKVFAAACAAWIAIAVMLPRALMAADQPPAELARWLGWRIAAVAGAVVAVLLVAGLVDLVYQRWQYLQDLKMTRREFLEDLRQMEGGMRRARAPGAERVRGPAGASAARDVAGAA
jgi:flagellar biosynthetic protein FlhB